MAVKVKVGSNENDHQTATDVKVAEGHLLVLKHIGGTRYNTIAVYKPDYWLSAVVVDRDSK